MTSMTEITCKCGCGRKKMVRTVDVKRGWGLFYSKSCKAQKQENRTHRCANHYARIRQMNNNYLGSGVSKEKFLRYANQYGGAPQFNRNGEYQGFCQTYFDNTQHQNSCEGDG